MSSGTKAGVGAALQQVGQGLMQYGQFNYEDARQRNLEQIRQQERGEDRAERQARYATEDNRYADESKFRHEQADKDEAFRQKSLASQEQSRRDARDAAASARADAREQRIIDTYESIPNRYTRRLEAIDKAELDGTSSPEAIQNARMQVAREMAAEQEGYIKRHPFLKSYTVNDYINGDGGTGGKDSAAPAAAAAPASAAPAAEQGGKKVPAGLMTPTAEDDPAARAVERAGLQPTESIGTTVKEALSSAGERISGVAKGAADQWTKDNALAQVRSVMNRLSKTGTIPIDTVKSIAESSATEEELRKVGADDRVIKIIREIRSSM